MADQAQIPLAIDTQGAQIRTQLANTSQLSIKHDDTLKIYSSLNNLDCEPSSFVLTPNVVWDLLQVDDYLRIDFNGAVIKITAKYSNYIEAVCIKQGPLGNNKGVDCMNRRIKLPGLSERDVSALNMIDSLNISTVYASFCSDGSLVDAIRSYSSRPIEVIAKIENKIGIHKLSEITSVANGLLIDRGDLSREISILGSSFCSARHY